jgi:hypothetical protein
VTWSYTRGTPEMLRCDLCGEQADTIHICFDDDNIEVVFACPAHDPGGYWIEVQRWFAETLDWINHLGEKDWGFEAIRKLAVRLDESRIIKTGASNA